MPITLQVDLHKTAKSVIFLPLFMLPASFLAGHYVSFYFHFLTVALLFVNVINGFYLFVQTRHTLLRNFGVLAQTRYLVESVGPEMRRYLFASDTEGRLFDRLKHAEVYSKRTKLTPTSTKLLKSLMRLNVGA